MRVPGRPRHLLLSWNGTRNSRFIAQGLLRPAEHLAGSHPAAPLAHLFPHEWFRTFGVGCSGRVNTLVRAGCAADQRIGLRVSETETVGSERSDGAV